MKYILTRNDYRWLWDKADKTHYSPRSTILLSLKSDAATWDEIHLQHKQLKGYHLAGHAIVK